jgi:hypothetical protein
MFICTRTWPRRKDEEEFCLARFGYRPGDYAEDFWSGRATMSGTRTASI